MADRTRLGAQGYQNAEGQDEKGKCYPESIPYEIPS